MKIKASIVTINDIEEAVNELISKKVDVQGIKTNELTNKRFCFFYDANEQFLGLNYMKHKELK